jgi:exopolyphosphatase/pppGpp-phosphohydrolase
MIGVIDIGSNSTNLLISHNGNTLVREQKITRLGTGVLRTKMLSAESMENTLQVDDRVAVNRIPFISNDIKRGDVVVFRDPDN